MIDILVIGDVANTTFLPAVVSSLSFQHAYSFRIRLNRYGRGTKRFRLEPDQ